MFFKQPRKIEFIRESAPVSDFGHRENSVFQHAFRITEPGFNQKLVRCTACHFPEQPPEMGIGNGKPLGFILKTPVLQRPGNDFFPQQQQFMLAKGIDFDSRSRLFLQLKKQILQHLCRPRLQCSARLSDQLMQFMKNGIEPFRMDHLYQRIFPVQFQHSPGNKTPDQGSAETDKTVVPIFPGRCAITEIRPGISDKGVWALHRNWRLPPSGKGQRTGMIVLNPIVSPEAAGMRDSLRYRNIAVGIENQFFIILHAEIIKMSIFLLYLSILLLKIYGII